MWAIQDTGSLGVMGDPGRDLWRNDWTYLLVTKLRVKFL